MVLALNEKQEILRKHGAIDSDMDALLKYTSNVFSGKNANDDESFLFRWNIILNAASKEGAAVAINKYIVRSDLQISFVNPEGITVEFYESIAGKIPVITIAADEDFDTLITNIYNKGKPYPHAKKQGASFANGENNKFIILSYKPYSNLPANEIGLPNAEWIQKSLTIRKAHECAHYYTTRFFGSSRNNLHDELIADFCGIWDAFSMYQADYFTRFLAKGRMDIYVDGMSSTAAKVIESLAYEASKWLEAWSHTDEFLRLNTTQRIDYLCKKELLAWRNL